MTVIHNTSKHTKIIYSHLFNESVDFKSNPGKCFVKLSHYSETWFLVLKNNAKSCHSNKIFRSITSLESIFFYICYLYKLLNLNILFSRKGNFTFWRCISMACNSTTAKSRICLTIQLLEIDKKNSLPPAIYLLKVNPRRRCKICSKLTIKTLETMSFWCP